jgi:VIT1/CCC1 family predicted Fe2+/Mn2+ transporter
MDQKDWDDYYEKQNRDFASNQQEAHDRLHHGIGAPVSRLPVFAGVLSVGFGALLGAIFGLFVFQDTLGAIASAAVGGAAFFVLRLAFGGASFDRPAVIRYAAIGAIAGFALNVASALFLRMSVDTVAGIIIGLVCGLAYYGFVGRHRA